MALDLNRWFAYAKARAGSAVDRGNRSLDRREAERAAELADKPWLGSDGDAPSFDEVRARIAWESERQVDGGEARAEPEPATPAEPGTGPRHGSAPVDPVANPGPAPRSPQDVAADAEHEGARLELERRQQAATERLRAIRDELGVDHQDPSDP